MITLAPASRAAATMAPAIPLGRPMIRPFWSLRPAMLLPTFAVLSSRLLVERGAARLSVRSFAGLAGGASRPLVMTPSLHPVAADRHQAPARVVCGAAVDQEQLALIIRARAQPPRALFDGRVPCQD